MTAADFSLPAPDQPHGEGTRTLPVGRIGPTFDSVPAGAFGGPSDVALRLEGVAASQPPLQSLLGEAARMLRTISGTVAKDPANAERARKYRARKRDASATMGVTVRDSSRDGGAFGGVTLGSEKAAFGAGNKPETKTNTEEKTQTIQSLNQPEVRAGSVRDATRGDALTQAQPGDLIPRPSAGILPGFARFYNAYPPAERRASLARLWVTMGLEPETARILAGLELWKMCERWQDTYVLNMREWMENRKWNDPPPPPRPKADAAVSDAPSPTSTDALAALLNGAISLNKKAGLE